MRPLNFAFIPERQPISAPENLSVEERICAYYRSYFDEIYSFVYRYGRTHEDAQDLAQDVFAKAMLYLRQTGNEIENPRAWLYKIARSHCIDRILRKKKPETAEVNPETIAARDTHSRFEDSILDRAMIDSVLEWVAANLSETEQQIFELKILRGLSLTEVGEIMSCHASTISRILSAITQQITERFA